MLRQEEEIKNQVMSEKLKTIKDQIESLSSTISDIEMALRAKDLPFLQVLLQNIMDISIRPNDTSNTCSDSKLQMYYISIPVGSSLGQNVKKKQQQKVTTP